MQLELQCQKCDEQFDVDPGDLAADPELKCPGCGAKATLDQAEALSGALEELFAAVAALRRKFTITGELDSEDLPSPHDGGTPTLKKRASADGDEDDEEEADEDE